MFRKDVLQIGCDVHLDTTVFSRLGKLQLPLCSPCLFILEPSMFRHSGIIKCIDKCLCKGLYAAVLQMGSVVEAMVKETAADALDI